MLYSSKDSSKQFQVLNPGHFMMTYDTRKEWRQGCNLSLTDGSQNKPRFGDKDTNWPHFLIGRHIEDPSSPNRELALGKYGLRWKSAVLRHKNHPERVGNKINVNQIYALVPMFYSENASQHRNTAPWINADQYGNVVYFAPGYPSLAVNKWVNFDIDVERLAVETLGQLKSKYGESLEIQDYHVTMSLIGWEVWGGYQSQVEVKDLALFPTVEQSDQKTLPVQQPDYVRQPQSFKYGDVMGGIDGILIENGRQFVWGWACSKGAAVPIDLHIYTGAPHPRGTLIVQAKTSLPGELGVSNECLLPVGQMIRYKVEIPSPERIRNQPVYIYGIHPSGDPLKVKPLGGGGFHRIK